MPERRDGFYLIYECDGHCYYDSMVIKAILTKESQAIAHYTRIESAYPANGAGWRVKMGFLPKDHDMQDDGDILRQLEDVTPVILHIRDAKWRQSSEHQREFRNERI